ncbi:MAG: hypothetical protein P4L84_15760 [Isosphaeraceae bacterium]|nr:hypothetical protein [Isosphaeraceae bacterium]
MSGSSVVIPNPRVPSVLGVLNIVFGILLLLSSLAVVGWTLAYPHFVKMMVVPGGPQQAQKREAEIEARLAELHKKLASEQDPNLRQPLQGEIEMLEDEQATMDLSADDLNGRDMKDPRMAVPFWADHGLGILLNALMLASGTGLVALRPWGRRLAVQVAAAKVVKLVVLTLVAVFLTIPIQTVRTRQVWAKMEARSRSAAPRGPSMGNKIAQMTAITGTVTTVGFGFLGMLYPVLSLWLLNKRTVRAAFDAAKRIEKPGGRGAGPSDLS